MVVTAARVKGLPVDLWLVARRSSRSCPRCRLSAYMSLLIGSTNEMPLRPVVAQLTQDVEAYHPTPLEADFALLHQGPMLLRQRFEALFFAPLLGARMSP